MLSILALCVLVLAGLVVYLFRQNMQLVERLLIQAKIPPTTPVRAPAMPSLDAAGETRRQLFRVPISD